MYCSGPGGTLTDQATFASIAVGLASDRTWSRRVRWIALRSRLKAACLRALSETAAAAGTWIV